MARTSKKAAKSKPVRKPAKPARKPAAKAARPMRAMTKKQAPIYDFHLDKNPANFAALTPLHFLERAAFAFPDHPAVVHGRRRYTWAQVQERARRLASALAKRGVGKGDTVAVMAPNIPEIYEATFGIPMTGGVINALNTRLSAGELAFILNHGEAKVLLTDTEFAPTIEQTLAQLGRQIVVIDICDSEGPGGKRLGETDYESFLAGGDPGYAWTVPADEWQSLALNYTSGTTGNPKGVVYSHRGACLSALNNAIVWSMPQNPVYLWTLPMFHCNGWTFPWTLAAMNGTNVCLRRVSAGSIYQAIQQERVTHLCGAPTVLTFIINAKPEEKRAFGHICNIMTAAAPPPPSVLENIEKSGFTVTHVYGLTECYGPATVCAWHPEWDALDSAGRAAKKARQGIRYPLLEGLMVADPVTLQPVPRDAATLGEVFMRGNMIMKGYLKNPKATDAAFEGGWFHTGDLAVWHPDGYIDLKDRSKDIIISGGENISTIELEGVIMKHAAVLACAVVGKPDEKWGETPFAFVTLKEGMNATAEEIVAHCRANIAHYKCPKRVVFGALPTTSTGKVQKFVLRDRAKTL